MKLEWRYMKSYVLAISSKGDSLTVRLWDDLVYLSVNLQGDGHVVKSGEVGKQTYITAVHGRRVEDMESEEFARIVFS